MAQNDAANQSRLQLNANLCIKIPMNNAEQSTCGGNLLASGIGRRGFLNVGLLAGLGYFLGDPKLQRVCLHTLTNAKNC